jgi:hypothetical protein
MLSKDVVDICTKVRAVVFEQMKTHAFWAMFFGALQLTLFWIGRIIIQPYSEQGDIMICIG